MTWHIDVENIGGIRSGSASIEPGVNAIQASNWRGKSSLIRAIEVAVATTATPTEGADRGRVALETPERTIEAEVRHGGDGIARSGDACVADERDRTCVELFAFLDEDNAVRRAVRTGGDLDEVLTRPLDFERLDERIEDRREDREEIEAGLERVEAAAADLPAAQERLERLESTIEELRTERDELLLDAETEEPATERMELSDALAERDRLAEQREQLQDTIENTRERLEATRAELDALTVPEASTVEADLESARERLAVVEEELELLRAVHSANTRVLNADRIDLLAEVDRSIAGDTMACWVCGSDVDRAAIEQRLDTLADRIADRREAAAEIRSTVADHEAEREAIRERRRTRRELEGEIDDLETTLADREESLRAIEDRLDDRTDRIEALREEVQEADDRLTDVESEIKYTSARLDDAREELASLEELVERRSTLEEQRDEVAEEIEALRTRKERMRAETREAFDEAIQTVVDRVEPGFELARLTPSFELVVARDGREVDLDALSEGEVELLGIVAALAGHEAYNVDELVPIILLDSVGDLAGENLGPLVQYLAERAPYVVTTAYPDQTIPEDHRIDPAMWSVVSRDIRSNTPT